MKDRPTGPRHSLSKLPLFYELDDIQLAAIASQTREITVNRGEMLFQQGDHAEGFYLVLSGQVKLALPSIHGNEKVLAIVDPGQTFGEAAMFLKQAYPVRAEALVKSVVLYFGSQVIFDLLTTDALFARKLLAGLSMRLHQLVMDVELYSQRSSMQRVIGYLLQQGTDNGNGEQAFVVELTTAKQVIASRLNLAPETLSRILHELSENGLIDMSGRRISIHDPAALREYEP